MNYSHFAYSAFLFSVVDPRPGEWKRSLASYTLSNSRQQHCLTFVNNNVLIFGGEMKLIP